MKQTKLGRSVNIASPKIILNKERDEEDNKQFNITMQNSQTRYDLDTSWQICLGYGDDLIKQRCNSNRVTQFLIDCGIASSDRDIIIARRSLDLFIDEYGDNTLDFEGFVKTLYYIGMEHLHQPGEYQNSLLCLMSQYLVPYNIRHKKESMSDGSEPDEELLSIVGIDRNLYIYDSILERLFNWYRDTDTHSNRELSLNQNKVLNQYIEVEEMKEFLKEYGIFPKMVAYSDISRCCQYACFGKLVVDPTKQGAGRYSNIDADALQKKASNKFQEPEIIVGDIKEPQLSDRQSANPIYLPVMPAEYLTDEALLDKGRFMSALVRLSQVIFSRPENGGDKFPTKASRFDGLLQLLIPTYEKMFQRKALQDCDFDEKGPPVLSTSGACSPPVGPNTGFSLTIFGSNFCEKRGVFVKFGEGEGAIVVRCKSISKKKIIVDTPVVKTNEVDVKVEFRRGDYAIILNRVIHLRIECSNNRWHYSVTEPLQEVKFQQELPHYTLDKEKSTQLIKLFAAVCAFGDHFNKKLMTLSKWKMLKAQCSLSEAINDSTKDNDVFFLEVAEFHDGPHNLTLNFEGFLRVLARTLLEMRGDEWVDGLQFVASQQFETQKRHGVECGVMAGQSEVALAMRAIAEAERRAGMELDVFLGPILVGVLKSRPGDIITNTSGLNVVVSSNPNMSYFHQECNSESIVLAHIAASMTIHHFIRRLLHDGFDVACHNPVASSRKPAGRCWAVSNDKGIRVGALWDYGGHYSNIEWQPAVHEMCSQYFTMCTYCEESSMDFIVCYIVYSKSNDISDLRKQLQKKGFSLTTKLYRVP